MNRIAITVAVALAFAASDTIAQTEAAAKDRSDKPAASAEAKAKLDQGIRKLSRRERKDRRAALPEKYQQWLLEVEPIMVPEELDTFLILDTDPQRDLYIDDFWRRRDRAQGTTNFTFREQYFERLEEAKVRFKYLASDRSKMFLVHGEPAEVVRPSCGEMLQPIEIWKYPFLAGFGRDRVLLFYIPRRQNDYKLWVPILNDREAMSELLSEARVATANGSTDDQVDRVFVDSMLPGARMSRAEFECISGDELMRAVAMVLQNRTEMTRAFNPPPVNEEEIGKVLRSVVLANPNAPKLTAEFKVAYPAKQGLKTDAQMTILVPRAAATAKDVGGTKTYSFDVTGEVLKDEKLFENFRYRFDFPGDVTDEKLPIIVDRFLRPNAYQTRLKVTDIHSGAEALLVNPIEVPEIFETAETKQRRMEASEQVATIKDAIESNETTLRIVPPGEELLSGVQQIDTIAIGNDIAAVEFYLDGRKIMVKRQPPYTLDLDFGEVPRVRRIRAVALDAKGQIVTGDEVVVNTGTDPFRVRIVSPRVAVNVQGPTRVQLSVDVPDGKTLDHVKLFYNETAVATLYGAPWVQTINIPRSEGVSYIRAVASLKDDSIPPIEDVVMINTPQFMEQVDVHLIELPTTVLVNGRPVNTLPEAAFKVLDEGKPVKIAKFEHVKNLPLSVGMAFDTSGSMLTRMNEAQKAGARFFQNVMRPGDKGFLVAFATQPELMQKWSEKLADLNAGISKLRAEESTALYDAIVYSLYNFVGVKGQKALIVVTDGRDTSSKFSFEQALEYARRTAVPIYAIAVAMKPSEVDARIKLGKFCSETGGTLYSIEHASQLAKMYDEIEAELRSQYVLGFYPPDEVKPGSKWREVTVQVSEGKARTIRGYYP